MGGNRSDLNGKPSRNPGCRPTDIKFTMPEREFTDKRLYARRSNNVTSPLLPVDAASNPEENVQSLLKQMVLRVFFLDS